jgi:hypothetical protein
MSAATPRVAVVGDDTTDDVGELRGTLAELTSTRRDLTRRLERRPTLEAAVAAVEAEIAARTSGELEALRARAEALQARLDAARVRSDLAMSQLLAVIEADPDPTAGSDDRDGNGEGSEQGSGDEGEGPLDLTSHPAAMRMRTAIDAHIELRSSTDRIGR